MSLLGPRKYNASSDSSIVSMLTVKLKDYILRQCSVEELMQLVEYSVVSSDLVDDIMNNRPSGQSEGSTVTASKAKTAGDLNIFVQWI